LEARKLEEKELPREYMGLQRGQGVTVKLKMAGGRVLNIQEEFYFGLNDVQPNIETPPPLEQQQPTSAQIQSSPAQTQSLPAHIQSPPTAQPQSLPDNKDEAESTERFETDDQLNSGDDSDSDNSFATVVPNKPRPQQTDNYSSNINNIFFSLALFAIYNSNSSKI
jgi:type IV secretory pathway VirB10-like protein